MALRHDGPVHNASRVSLSSGGLRASVYEDHLNRQRNISRVGRTGRPLRFDGCGIQRAIMAADTADVIGWMIDVRGNRGRNMWPMVAGVGPLLGEGVTGYFIDPTGVESAWEYRDGASWDGGVVQQRVDAPYRPRRNGQRVAVLSDNATSSSGEATVIAFKGRSNTRFFGTPTCGLPTAIENYPMSDGASLNLTVSVMADRTRTKYGFSVAPDELIPNSPAVVERAIAWLRTGN